jgi:hypothetical protein
MPTPEVPFNTPRPQVDKYLQLISLTLNICFQVINTQLPTPPPTEGKLFTVLEFPKKLPSIIFASY